VTQSIVFYSVRSCELVLCMCRGTGDEEQWFQWWLWCVWKVSLLLYECCEFCWVPPFSHYSRASS